MIQGKPIPRDTRRLIAALVKLHRDTHPEIIARTFGVTSRSVRNYFSQMAHAEFPRLYASLTGAEHIEVKFTTETAHGKS